MTFEGASVARKRPCFLLDKTNDLLKGLDTRGNYSAENAFKEKLPIFFFQILTIVISENFSLIVPSWESRRPGFKVIFKIFSLVQRTFVQYNKQYGTGQKKYSTVRYSKYTVRYST